MCVSDDVTVTSPPRRACRLERSCLGGGGDENNVGESERLIAAGTRWAGSVNMTPSRHSDRLPGCGQICLILNFIGAWDIRSQILGADPALVP
jgi:hypothetical protein